MAEKIHFHICPRCGRTWDIGRFMQLTDLGLRRVLYREDGQVRVKYTRSRWCSCYQVLQQTL